MESSLLRHHLEGLLDVLARLCRRLGEADPVVCGKVARLLRRHFAVTLRERIALLTWGRGKISNNLHSFE